MLFLYIAVSDIKAPILKIRRFRGAWSGASWDAMLFCSLTNHKPSLHQHTY